ncbi:P-loop containing nucleoside triphosphate hydrolase protein [Naematelia encephala]|uniref:p-loop containing nucleoside triphosphate hydrolase protein n=1 Tax=Naematelia encephala TaxID=71784 RepID=A0A1Y2AY21_9TREE|nr:P-loop containing nucleoside triphosphate hydrolase protein [Naematelia encephala]
MIYKACRGCRHISSLSSAVRVTSRSTVATLRRRVREGISENSSIISCRRTTSSQTNSVPALQDGIAESSSQPEYDIENEASTSSYSSAITLRPYQEDAITKCLDAIQSGKTRIGVSSPTGSGKTTMFMNLIPQVPYSGQGRGRTFILVSSVELANQAEEAVKQLLGDKWTVEVEQSKRKASGAADVTIATYQTLNNIERLRKFDPSKFKLVIVDEAHHAAADSYRRVLHYFNDGVQLHSSLPPITTSDHGCKVPIVGFSATFSRPDQLALSSVFEEIVFHREITSMLQDGWLSPTISTTVKAGLNLDSVKFSKTGDYSTSSLARQVDTLVTNDLIVRTYLHRASHRRSTLIFCVDLTHVANLTQTFRDAGIDARSVSSLTQPLARKQTISAFAKGEFPVLLNCEVLTEGTDIPVIDCIILARPTRSKNLLAQMIGRGLRLSPATGKENCHIIDVVDSMSDGLLVTPTLLGIEHEGLHESVKEREVSTEERGEPNYSDIRVTYIDESDPFGINSARTSTTLPLNKITPNAWVVCGHHKFTLELLQEGWIQVKPNTNSEEPGKFVITRTRQMELEWGMKKHFLETKVLGYADTMERAIQAGDVSATRILGFEAVQALSRRHPWRSKPASEKAIAFLIKFAKIEHEDEDSAMAVQINGRSIPVNALTAGQVSSYIAGIKHGAKGVRGKQQAQEARKQAKVDAKKVKIGEQAQKDLPLPLPSS